MFLVVGVVPVVVAVAILLLGSPWPQPGSSVSPSSPARPSPIATRFDGPVVKDARAALESNDVAPALKWVRPDQEGEVHEAFRHALAVRPLGPEAQALADRFFFETLVRVHREGEGAPYTGLKPAGTAVDPGIAASDRALETGSVEPLAKLHTAEVEKGLRHRFAEAAEARKHAAESVEEGRRFVAAREKKAHAGDSVEAGRAYVNAYVPYLHFVERLYKDATTPIAHGEGEGASAESGHPAPATEHKH